MRRDKRAERIAKPTFEVDPAAATMIVTLPATIRQDDAVDDRQLEECASRIVDWIKRTPSGEVRVHLDQLAMVTSHVFGWLIILRGNVANRGGRFRLCGLQPGVRNVVSVLKLEHLLNVEWDERSGRETSAA